VKSKGLLIEDEGITRYLSRIGVSVNFHYLTDWPKFKKMLQEGDAPIFKYSWQADVPDPDNILSMLFHSTSPTNRAFYSNPEVDALIEKAQNESDYPKRISLFSEIEGLVMEDAPVILMNYLAYERVFQPYVRNIKRNALGDHAFPLKHVWLEK
jgi:ABC-type transport system substrate-binding protein